MKISIKQYPCAKQTVTAKLVCPDGTVFTDTNWCHNNVQKCPREVNHMESGQGYDLCRTVCRQEGHAEVNVCHKAEGHTQGAVLYLTGHTYVCDHCKAILAMHGVTEIHIQS